MCPIPPRAGCGPEQAPPFFTSAWKLNLPNRQAIPMTRKMCARQHDHTETDIPVPVVRIVPVARGTPHVPSIIVERTAAQHPGALEPIPPCN
jgi:hypothetical protein